MMITQLITEPVIKRNPGQAGPVFREWASKHEP